MKNEELRQELTETKKTKGVSRRRFMISAASVGMVAGTIGASRNPKAVDCWIDIESWTENERCRNMMRLFCDVTFDEMFNSTTVWDALQGHLSRLSAADRASIEPFVLAAQKSGWTLYDLFANDLGTWPTDVQTTCAVAATKATMPFYFLPDGEDRYQAAIFLSWAGGTGTSFFDAFGTQTFYEVYTKPIDKVRDETIWELHLLRRAKELGILRPYRDCYDTMEPASKSLSKGRCGCHNGSEWECKLSPDENDVCGVDNGVLQFGSDFCPLPC